MTTTDRARLIQRIARSLCRRSFPRLQMALIATAVGLAGFLGSFVLLHLGLDEMWLRYPLAVGVSYIVFFLLLRLWITYQNRSFTEDLIDAADFDPTDLFPNGRSCGATSKIEPGNSWDSLDCLSGLDGDEWLALIVFLIALLVSILASLYIVVSAPTLLGEVFLDAIVITALRKKMVRLAGQHWTWSALRRTAIPFLLVSLLFSAAGGVIHQLRPEVKSIGGVFHVERASK